jgi:beta-1,4-mannosyl-glycoprotein beta-1,4-N-acetylglucosaminyltransferase
MVLFIDSFLFNGEDIVKLRLEFLDKYVDYFYIVESIYTFSGNKKEFYYIDKCRDWFTPYLDKIKFIKINTKLNIYPDYFFSDSNKKCFAEEKLQRNYVRDFLLKDFESQEFILALCDVDEIFDYRALESKEELFKILQTKHILLKMKMYYYKLNYFINDNWEMAFLISSTMLKQNEYKDLDYIRVNKLGSTTIRRTSGWHFTYFMTPEEIQRKLQSFSHSDINRYPFTDIVYLRSVLSTGIDYQQRDEFKFQNLEFDNPIHEYPELFRKYYQ